MADDVYIPADDEIEADFDAHETPTKVDRPPCVPAADFRSLLEAVVTIERSYLVNESAFRETERMEAHRTAMARLCDKYGVER